MRNLTEEELKKILLTSDGKGKEVKEKALLELLYRVSGAGVETFDLNK